MRSRERAARDRTTTRTAAACATFPGEEVAALSRDLAETLEDAVPELVVGIARAGLFPAFVVAAALRRELCVIRISRRVDEEVTFEHPVWRVPLPSTITGRVVAVVDEIADSDETLECLRRAAIEQGAARIVTVALAAHSWAQPQPDLVALASDELVVFPWDERILAGGRWIPLPEVEDAIGAQRRREEPG